MHILNRTKTQNPRNIFAVLNSVNRDYSKGQALTFDQAIDHITSGKWVYWRDRAYHPEFMLSLSIRTVKRSCESGSVHEAVKV